MFKIYNGELKNHARSIALSDFQSCETSIFLPSWECRCVTQAFHNNVINHDSNILFVEKNKNIAPLIKEQTLDFKNSEIFNSEIEKVKINTLIDFAYLDFVGSMDEPIYNWIKTELIPNLAANYKISFCFNYAWRPDVPFLRAKFDYYTRERKIDIFHISKKYSCNGSHQIATYFLLFKELFGDKFHYIFNDGRPYFKYQDERNSVVLYTLEAFTQKEDWEMAVKDEKFQELVAGFAKAWVDYDKRRGWNRKKTVWSNKRSKETGQPPSRFIAALKMRLTKLGYDSTCIKV